LAELRSELGPDANVVVDLLVFSCTDIQLLLRNSRTRHQRHTVVCAVQEHLEDLGWDQARIHTAFRSITRALNPAEPQMEFWPEPLRVISMAREDVWLLARVGLTREDIRLLLSR
jgi:hypothetical protein